MLLESWRTAHTDQQFNAIVRMALNVTALAIIDEKADVPNHAVRLVLAKRVLSEDAFLDSLTVRACEVLALGGLNGQSDDKTILGAIGQRVDQIAGLFAPAAVPITPGPTMARADDPEAVC